MKERLIKFITDQHISASKIADDIGVQRSSISHILSGRNNPSFDFIQKMLTKYKSLNAEWLIIGTGNMLKPMQHENLFESEFQETNISEMNTGNAKELTTHVNDIKVKKESQENEDNIISNKRIIKTDGTIIEKIITIYSNNTFDIYLPAK